MKKIHILITLVGLLALAAVPTASQIAPSAAKEWNVNNTDSMSYATDYELYK